jgi:hypothetical protein
VRKSRPSGSAARSVRRDIQRISALALIAIFAAAVPYVRATLASERRADAAANLKVAVPAYVFPGQAPLVTLGSMSPAPGLVILNPGNGDAPFSASWQAQANVLRARGTVVLGYVHTDHGSRPIPAVEESVNNYLKPASGRIVVSGIFFDEMSISCTEESYYHQLYQYVRNVDPAAFVADNPGTAVNVCDLRSASTVANTFVTFEHDAQTYLTQYAGNIVGPTGSHSSGAQYPAATFWHLIYGASGSQMPQLVSLAAARHAGYVYATDGNLPNPWDSVASYVNPEAQTAAATRPK